MSDNFGGWMGRRGLSPFLGVHANQQLPVSLALPCGVRSFLHGFKAASSAYRAQCGCSWKKALKSENSGHKSLQNLGSLVALDYCPTVCKWPHGNVHAFAFSGVFETATCHLVSAKEWLYPLQILFPASTDPDAVGSDGLPGFSYYY